MVMTKMMILKSEPKHDDRENIEEEEEEDKINMVQIHDEQWNIQITMSHSDAHKNAAWPSFMIINNRSKNIKYWPKSDI